MARNVRIYIDDKALDSLLNGRVTAQLKQHIGNKVAQKWRDNIHDITHATDDSIDVETKGNKVEVVAQGPESAWVFREFGTSTQRADRSGRRALRESRK